MTHDRSYKPTYSKEIAIEELKTNSGTQFDPNLIDIFVNFVMEGQNEKFKA